MKKRKIILTGGGSAGHVTPNVALIPNLKKLGYEVEYIGTKDGIERRIIEGEGIKYHVISSGKLRRYFDVKNFTDPFKVIKGIFEAKKIIKKAKPNVIFSKGGFVSVPVVLGGFFNKVPVIAHESDITPGLANKIATPYCKKICITFPESIKNIKGDKCILTGTPIREDIFQGKRERAISICNFTDNKSILLVIGGSLGSKVINDAVRKSIDKLLKEFNIIHICGKDNIDNSLKNKKGYAQFEYVKEELSHFMNGSDVVISRAGANVIFELLALRKPNLLIPLSKKSSRGDQILNAESFKKSGYSAVLEEEELNEKNILRNLKKLCENKSQFIKAMEQSPVKNGVDNIIKVINKYSINR